jgi:hypothetical protein
LAVLKQAKIKADSTSETRLVFMYVRRSVLREFKLFIHLRDIFSLLSCKIN